MCFNERSNDKFKCTVIAMISLVVHVTLTCLLITALTLRLEMPNLLQGSSNHSDTYFGITDVNTFFGANGVSLALGILGIVASVMLIIGLRKNKPGYVAAYLCYGVQMSIVLLIGGLLLWLKIHWIFALATLGLSALTIAISVSVYSTYEAMLQDKHQNSISDLTLLLTEDTEDTLSIPAE